MNGLLELYPDANEPVGLDFGDEFPRIRATGTTFGGDFPDPEEWLALNAPTGWLSDNAAAETIPSTQTEAA